MKTATLPHHTEALRDLLNEEIERIRRLLKGTGTSEQDMQLWTLVETAEAFGLTDFERDLLMLATAVELDSETANEVSRLLGSDDPRPTPGLAMGLLPGPHWDAFLPGSPLRSWKLIELEGGGPLALKRLSVDERLVHHLLGLEDIDQRLRGIATVREPSDYATPSQLAVADRCLAQIEHSQACLVHLTGEDISARRAIASAVAAGLGASPLLVSIEALPQPGGLLHDTVRLIEREWVLARRLPVIVAEPEQSELRQVIETSTVPVVVVIGGSLAPDIAHGRRITIQGRVQLPSPAEQADLWHQLIDRQRCGDLDRAIEDTTQSHRLSATSIVAVASRVATGGAVSPATLREACREQSRVNVEPLAQLVSPNAGWDDLVLPAAHLATLHDIVRQVRHRAKVYESWGFAERTSCGLGVTALFAGESGTGKTLAAEVIANDLGLDLYRIDLSATVSKYIGETEKNLARVFDAAESSGAVLLFDEADALFGKRTEVRDSHDRYANLEVAYLLQSMEAYRGLAILTTNLRSNLDPAFARRLRFIIQFPFPDQSQREEIWGRVFPSDTPLDGLEPSAMAAMNITGGSIWAIALSAAFAAAEEGESVSHSHILRAARTEYAKLERSLTSTERAGLE